MPAKQSRLRREVACVLLEQRPHWLAKVDKGTDHAAGFGEVDRARQRVERCLVSPEIWRASARSASAST
jgi:hypothetical protein